MFKFLKRKDILTSSTDIGLIRQKNEDCVTTLFHPHNKSIKLLAVADGIGGYPKGEVASKFVIESLEDWFIHEKMDILGSAKKCTQKLYDVIVNINNILYLNEFKKSKCGTTLTCAIVTKQDTIIANIGDSRAYAIINGEIKQLTKDDSLVWSYYEYGKISKDEMRFHNYNNLITKCIGHAYNTYPTILKISNKDYDGLLLLTDGVTDCLSDDKIKFIVGKNNGKNIANKLINEAVYQPQNNNIPTGLQFSDVKNGKDNASVALYMKYSSLL